MYATLVIADYSILVIADSHSVYAILVITDSDSDYSM
jgi:hypothetical protein